MVLAYLLFFPKRFLPIFPMVSLLDFSCPLRQGFTLLCQLLVSPGILPGRLISSSFTLHGATSLFRVYTRTELARC